MKTVKILENIQDVETGIIHKTGEEVSVSVEKADRWIGKGYVKEVTTKALPTTPSNKAEKEFK